jgi:hypothetical protein
MISHALQRKNYTEVEGTYKKKLHEVRLYICDWHNINQQSPASG